MELQPVMLRQLANAQNIVSKGAEVVPAWAIYSPEGDYLLFTRFDPAKPDQPQRALNLIRRFMVWKMATAFVMVSEIWLDGKATREEALLAVGVSRSMKIGALQRITHTPSVVFADVEWVPAEALDTLLTTLLPSRSETLTTEEVRELESVFGQNGELVASKLS